MSIAVEWTPEIDAWLLLVLGTKHRKSLAYCAEQLQCPLQALKDHVAHDLRPDLNDAQRAALRAVQQGQSIFLTGPAGTGKTFTLRAILAWAQQRANKQIGVTAMTGAAALLIGGRTLHSFLGIGLAKKDALSLAIQTRTRFKAIAQRLCALDLLVIDEISMADAKLLDTVSAYLQILRRKPSGDDGPPFGGVQLVLCGDFCQLPPVDGPYAFHAEAWKRLNPTCIHLRKLVRQEGDAAFQKLLARLRWGVCTQQDLQRLKSTSDGGASDGGGGIQPTRLYATNRDVDAINQAELEKLVEAGQPCVTYPMLVKTATSGETKHNKADKADKADKANQAKAEAWAASCGIPAQLQLSIGSQVVLTTNLDPEHALVNGSRGTVTALEPERVQVKWMSGATRWIERYEHQPEDAASQWKVAALPLKLAWAITIHKSQGMTLDAVEMDLGDSIFECGQAYTALSRARSLDAVRIVRVSPRAFRTHPDVAAFYGMAKPS